MTTKTGTGAVVLSNTPTLVTPVLGVATVTTINKVTLTAPATGSTLTILDGKTLTANSSLTLAGTDSTTMTFPNTSATMAGLGIAQTFSAANIFSAAGVASTPGLAVTGVPFTGGTTTTNVPQLYVNGGASAPSTFSINGTAIGVNAPSGWAGNFIDFHINGGGTFFAVSANGTITAANTLNAAGAVFAGASSTVGFTGRGLLSSPAAGTIQHGGADAASPVAQIVKFQSVIAGTTNTNSPSATITGPLSTGTGTPGDLILQTGTIGLTGSAQNAASTALTIKGGTQAIIIASGKFLWLGNAATTGLTAGVLAATTNASIVLVDSTGQAYRIPCII